MSAPIPNPEYETAEYEADPLTGFPMPRNLTKNNNRGGSRPGSGRKPRKTPLVPFSVRIEPELHSRLARAKKQTDSKSWPLLLQMLMDAFDAQSECK